MLGPAKSRFQPIRVRLVLPRETEPVTSMPHVISRSQRPWKSTEWMTCDDLSSAGYRTYRIGASMRAIWETLAGRGLFDAESAISKHDFSRIRAGRKTDDLDRAAMRDRVAKRAVGVVTPAMKRRACSTDQAGLISKSSVAGDPSLDGSERVGRIGRGVSCDASAGRSAVQRCERRFLLPDREGHPAGTGTSVRARIGPVSNIPSSWWIDAPVVDSPARKVQKRGSGPRWAGSIEGWRFNANHFAAP